MATRKRLALPPIVIQAALDSTGLTHWWSGAERLCDGRIGRVDGDIDLKQRCDVCSDVYVLDIVDGRNRFALDEEQGG